MKMHINPLFSFALLICGWLISPQSLIGQNSTNTAGNWDLPGTWLGGVPLAGFNGMLNVSHTVTIPMSPDIVMTGTVSMNIFATGSLHFTNNSLLVLSATSGINLFNPATITSAGNDGDVIFRIGGFNYTQAILDPLIATSNNYTLTANGAVLPAELVKFEAKPRLASTEINWETASECYVRSFEVERSTDSENFDKIGEAPASEGCTAVGRDYSFLDRRPASGANFYRLRTVDIDGAESISAIKSVDFSTKTGEITATPNFTTDVFSINNFGNDDARFFIRDLSGRLLKSGELLAGTTLELSASAWHSGIYQIIFEKWNSVEVARLVRI